MGPLEITQGLGQVSGPLSSQAVSISKDEALMTTSPWQPNAVLHYSPLPL